MTEEYAPAESFVGDHIIRLRGLPYSAQLKDIISHLSDCNVLNGEKGVKFSFSADGRPSGEVFVELSSAEDVEKALAHKNEMMGTRYVEIFKATRTQLEWDCRKEEIMNGADGSNLVRLQGLPFGCTEEQIQTFFSGLNIVQGGITIQKDHDVKETGEAFVKFASKNDVDNALARGRNESQHRSEQGIEPGIDHGLDLSQLIIQEIQIRSSIGDHIVRLRGLPYSAQVKDILFLLSDCNVLNGEKGVKFSFSADGRPSGEAFIELSSAEDVEKALAHNHENLGKRYVEIFRATRSQLEWDCRKEEIINSTEGSGVVRLRGLPFGCTEEQIRTFLSGLTIVQGGITIQRDHDGRESGEAYVELASKSDVDNALDRDRNEIQHRYIEVFRSSHSEVKPYKGARPTPYSRPGGRGGGFSGYGTFGGGGAKYVSGYEKNYRGGRGRGGGYGYGGDGGYFEDPGYYGPPQHAAPPHGSSHGSLIAYPPPHQPQSNRGGFGAAPGNGMVMSGPPASSHSVRMRGLPYSAKEKDISDFFSPLIPVRINVNFDQYERPSGEAEAYFSTHDDASAAMQKNNQNIGPRYIELFLNSSATPQIASSIPQYGAPPQQTTWQATAPMVPAASGGATGYSTGGSGSYNPGYTSQQASVGYQQTPSAQQYQQNTGYGYQSSTDNTGYGQAAQPQQWGSSY